MFVSIPSCISNSTGDVSMGYGGAGPSFAIELDMVMDTSVGDQSANHIGLDMGGDMHSVMQFPLPDLCVDRLRG